MDSAAWVELALLELKCNQKNLATKFGVSQTQISKWKKGEHMSHEMEALFRKTTRIGNHEPSFVLNAGSLQEAKKWERLIHHLAGEANDSSETGYTTAPLQDELNLLCWSTFDTLKKMGIEIPQKFPSDIDFATYSPETSEDDDIQAAEAIWDALHSNPISDLIYRIYLSLNDVYGFCTAYLPNFIDDDDAELFDLTMNIDSSLLDLAACKVDVSSTFAPRFESFKRKILDEYTDWISIVKNRAFRAGIPLGAELLDMVHLGHEELGNEAEAKSLGLQETRLHPDIYMNELLCGMRIIHQVLPAIMKKLGIYDDFKLDTTSLSIGRHS